MRSIFPYQGSLTLRAVLGRTREKNELDALLEAARDGRSAALVVHGEAGIGKSTLLADAVDAGRGLPRPCARAATSPSPTSRSPGCSTC